MAKSVGAGARGGREEPIALPDSRPFLQELRFRGIDYQRRLARLGVQDLEDGHRPFISVQKLKAFLELVEELSRDPDIGLAAGARLRITDMGLFGLLLRSSPNGESARDHCRAYQGGLGGVLQVDAVQVDDVIVCRRAGRQLLSSRTLAQYFCAVAVTCTRQLYGPVDPVEVRLNYPAPADTREHIRVLGSRLRFGEREEAVVFSADLMSRPTLHGDAEAARVLQRYVAALPGASAAPPNFVTRVRQLVADELARGRTAMPEVARQLKLSERTLRRQLAAWDTSFQSLLDEVRRERALQYVREPNYSAEALSKQLGFAGPPAFYRAFRRWTGSSWSDYRSEYAEKSGMPRRSPA